MFVVAVPVRFHVCACVEGVEIPCSVVPRSLLLLCGLPWTAAKHAKAAMLLAAGNKLTDVLQRSHGLLGLASALTGVAGCETALGHFIQQLRLLRGLDDPHSVRQVDSRTLTQFCVRIHSQCTSAIGLGCRRKCP